MADKPYYPHAPIGSVDVLAKTLGIRKQLLLELSDKISTSYTTFQMQSKSGKLRIVRDPKYELKKLQKRINSRVFELVEYPPYLQGGIKDIENKRDYVSNAEIHSGAQTLISVDIKNFFDNVKEHHVNKVFRYLFNFPDDVSSLLTKIVTFQGRLPQGACTSTYIANLIFFNSEYGIVSSLRGKHVLYSRLLDDITISSKKSLSDQEVTSYIKTIAGMLSKYDLRLNNGKTKIEYKSQRYHPEHYEVTGLWIGNQHPKLRRADRKYIRQLVYICEQKYLYKKTAEEYHGLWNRTSGLVAKMQRLKHKQANQLRKRLAKILPEYDEAAKKKIVLEVKKLLNTKSYKKNSLGLSSRLGKLYYRLGVLGRTNRELSRNLRSQLENKFSHIPSKKEMCS